VNGSGALDHGALDKVGSDNRAGADSSPWSRRRSAGPAAPDSKRMAGHGSRGWFVQPSLSLAVVSFIAWAVWGPAPALAYGAESRRSPVLIIRVSLPRSGLATADVDYGGRRQGSDGPAC